MNTDKPKKKFVNMLDYFGVKRFSIQSFVLYVLSFAGTVIVINLILTGGAMSALGWGVCGIGSLLAGTAFYFWDLNKSRKQD